MSFRTGVRNLFLSTAKTRFFGYWPQNDDLRQIGLTKSEQLPAYSAQDDRHADGVDRLNCAPPCCGDRAHLR